MNPTYDFRGQVALVTGAGAGMGLDTARAFAASGAAVVLADVDAAALRTATDELRDAGHQARGVGCDVADEGQVAALVEQTVAELGRLDMTFNNAGIMLPYTDAAEEPAEAFDRVSAINLRGVWACMKHELRRMRGQGSGAIVNCSSLGGLVGNPGRAAYHATKHGVLGLTRSAALEYAPRGIRINAVCPGTIETPMLAAMIAKGELTRADAETGQPIGRLGRGDEIAAGVSDASTPSPSPSATPASGDRDGTAIRIAIGDTQLTGRLADNATARDLADQLPLTLTFCDHNNVEKTAPLPRELSLDGGPDGHDPTAGDIGYWAPGGDLVLYYDDGAPYFDGIVRIGEFDGDLDALERESDDFSVSIKRAR